MRRGSTALRAASLFAFCSVLSFFAAGQARGAEEVKASHILLRSREEAEQVRKEIVDAGGSVEAFGAACRKYSLDVYTKKQAGDLGWFPRVGKMDPVFSEAAFALAEGAMSQPINTQHGWHLIYLKGKRDRSTTAASAASTPDADAGDADTGAEVSDSGDETSDAASQIIPQDPPQPPQNPSHAVEAEGKRRTLPENQLELTIESVAGSTNSESPNQFAPDRAAELNLILKNSGTASRTVPAVGLLPLGFSLVQHHDGKAVRSDFSSLAKPESFFVELGTYEMVGLEVSVNAFFDHVHAVGRFDLSWSPKTFFENLEARFPEVTETEGYAETKKDLDSSFAFKIDKVRRDSGPNWRRVKNTPYTFSILPVVRPSDLFYAKMTIRGESEPVWIELNTRQQFTGARHFMKLALEGFYDRVSFYDVEEGDYALAGCPSNVGTGAPSMPLPRVRNSASIPHQRGTVSFVSRHIREQGPIRGGEIGSIFFVSLKPHPEWNDVHVPFGRVVSGLDAFERVRRGVSIDSITVVPASEYSGPSGAPVVANPGGPRAVIKTSKGDLKVELFDGDAPNTVASFVTLAEDGFFDEAETGGNMKFFNLMTDETGRILIQTGSPTNDYSGGASYRLPDEVSERKCEYGTLVMSKLYDPEAGGYVADTASSQFFICLKDIPAYDFEKAFTVFGKVDAGSFGVLQELSQGDDIVEVEITQKPDRPYETFTKIPN